MNFKRQVGASVLSMFLMFVAFAFILTCFLKLFPIYQDAIFVEQGLKGLAEKHASDLQDITKAQVTNELSNFFTINSVRGDAADPKHIELERLREKTIIRINYEERINFIRNIDLVVWFKNELDSSKPQACCKPSAVIKK